MRLFFFFLSFLSSILEGYTQEHNCVPWELLLLLLSKCRSIPFLFSLNPHQAHCSQILAIPFLEVYIYVWLSSTKHGLLGKLLLLLLLTFFFFWRSKWVLLNVRKAKINFLDGLEFLECFACGWKWESWIALLFFLFQGMFYVWRIPNNYLFFIILIFFFFCILSFFHLSIYILISTSNELKG